MISGISNFNNYDILLKTSINALEKVDASDALAQNLFSASLVALYGKSINDSVMKDVDHFITSFDKLNKALLESSATLQSSLEKLDAEIDETHVAETTVPTPVDETTTKEMSDDENIITDDLEDAEEREQTSSSQMSSQLEATHNFFKTLSDTLDFLDAHHNFKETDLLSKRLNYDFKQRESDLTQIGITRNSSGRFEFSKDDLKKSLQDDPNYVREILTGPDGFTTKVSNRMADKATLSQQFQLQSGLPKGSILNMLL